MGDIFMLIFYSLQNLAEDLRVYFFIIVVVLILMIAPLFITI